MFLNNFFKENKVLFNVKIEILSKGYWWYPASLEKDMQCSFTLFPSRNIPNVWALWSTRLYLFVQLVFFSVPAGRAQSFSARVLLVLNPLVFPQSISWPLWWSKKSLLALFLLLLCVVEFFILTERAGLF